MSPRSISPGDSRSTPRYSTPGVTPRSPGIRTSPGRSTARTPGNAAPRYSAPRAVGGTVRPRYSNRTDRLSPSRETRSVTPRDLYRRGGTTTSPGASRKPVTSSRVVDRYRTRLQPRGGDDVRRGATRSSDRTAGRSGDVRRTPVAPRATGGRATPSTRTATPRGVRGTASHRYTQPGSPSVRTGSRSGTGRTGTLQPGLRRPTAVSGLVGRRSAPRVSAPRLNPRRSVYGSYGYGRYGYGRHHHRSLFFSLSFGIGFSHFGSGFYCYPYYYGAYWPYRYYGYCSSYGYYSYYRPWCYPYRYYGYSWWPRYCYLPSYHYYPSYYPSTVVVVGDGYDTGGAGEYAGEEGGETVVVGSRPAESAAALAEKYVNLGDYYFREGRFQDAADAYARARTYAPNDPSIHFVLADALFAVGDYHFAAYLINEAVRLDPDIARADTDKRVFYSDVKVFEEQMQTLLEYLGEKPYDAMAHLVLGYNLKFSGKKDEARLAFQKVLEIEPGNRAAQAFLMAIDEPDKPVLLEPEEAPDSRPADKTPDKAPDKEAVKKG